MSGGKIGVLLVNLGTPKEPTTRATRRYLAQFLSDPRVIDINRIGRWLLLHGIILRFRPRKSAAAYRAIWTERGSPLLFHSLDLRDAVAQKLGLPYVVALGMRYGEPSIASALDELEHVDQLVIVPLFPQYSSAATGSAVEEVMRVAASRWNTLPIRIVGDFFEHPGFIAAASERVAHARESFSPDTVVFSFHGLPQRHVDRSERGKVSCDGQGPCPTMGANNRFCYRAQCYATARAMAQELSLNDEDYHVSFQSRLGRTPWIKPYTDELLPKLVAAGKKRALVACPAFTADCLETLEEIGIRAREDWKAAGGEELQLVPCVNAQPTWVDAVCDLVRGAK